MSKRPRGRGERSAQMLAVRLMRGTSLPPHRAELLKLACRVLIHAHNISNGLYWSTEVTQQEEPRLALTRLLDLSREARELLGRAFPDGEFSDAADPLDALLMRGRGK